MEKFSEILKKEFYIGYGELLKTVKNPYFWLIQSVVVVVFFIIGQLSYSQSPQTLYIAIDSTTNSKMLKRELECTNWQARINPVVLRSLNPAQRSSFNEFCLRMEKSQKRILTLWTVEYVNYQDVDSPKGTYPQYRIGKNREWNDFDSQAFSEVSYPLRTVEYLYEEWYYLDFVDNMLADYEKEFNVWATNKYKIYHKWLNKAKKESPDKTIEIFMSKYYEKCQKELKQKGFSKKDEPKLPQILPPIRPPYE